MGVFDFFTRLTSRADLMDRMMRKLGLAEEMKQLPDHAGVYRRAANRCLSCDQPDACEEWLNANTDPASAPPFCRNSELFDRVLARVKDESASAA